MEKSAQVYGVTSLGAINGAPTCQPPLPPYRVGSMLHYVSAQLKVAYECLLYPFYSQEGTIQAHKAKGLVFGMDVNGVITKLGGIMKVAMLHFDWLESSAQVCCVGSMQSFVDFRH